LPEISGKGGPSVPQSADEPGVSCHRQKFTAPALTAENPAALSERAVAVRTGHAAV